jgi:hypothetical protein
MELIIILIIIYFCFFYNGNKEWTEVREEFYWSKVKTALKTIWFS